MPGPFVLSYVALWVLVVLQALILIGLTRVVYQLRFEPADRPSPQGRRIPNFSAVDLSGNPVSAASLAGKPAALLFVSPNCPSCMVSLAELSALARDSTRGLVVVCRGGDGVCSELATNYGLHLPVVADEKGDLMQLFGISATPTAVRISADGVIESYGEPISGEDLNAVLAASAGTEESISQAAGSEKTPANEYANL